MARWYLWDICCGFHLGSSCKVKACDQVILYSQAFHSLVEVFDSFLRGAGNITEAPPMADEARRCWRKTRRIAPAPRAIGDYVLRGLNGLRSKTHEPVLFELSEFTGECAEQLIESRELYTAARRCGGTGGIPPVLLFFCRRFLFQIKRKCRNAGSIYCLIIV